MPWNQQNNDKDPWERNKKQTPPDLDEVLKKFTASFGGMFGSKKPANGSGGGHRSWRRGAEGASRVVARIRVAGTHGAGVGETRH